MLPCRIWAIKNDHVSLHRVRRSDQNREGKIKAVVLGVS